MDIKKLAGTLHALERKVLPFLDRYSSLQDLVRETGLKEVEVMRALQWLQNKGIIELKEELKEVINLDSNGKAYLKDKLPEIRLLEAIKSKHLTISQARQRAKLTKEELNVSLGVLRKKAAIFITKEKKDLVIKIMPQGKKILEKGTLEEKFLRKEFPVEVSSLNDEERYAFNELKKRRNIIKTSVVKSKRAVLTELGKELLSSDICVSDIVDTVTSAMIKNGSWRGKTLRRYDVKAPVPSIYGGKKQHYRSFLDKVRQKFIAMGFTEMFGPLVETDFWNMDALFMPQFHSARDIHSAYYIKEPMYGKLDKSLVERVKKAHENGFGTGSKGWQYVFDVKRTHRHLLRTQGTALSARMLASGPKIPGKYFAIARCFRYDVIDATHNVDFYQTEGIVVEDGLNFKHLKGLLKLFAEEFAQTDQIRIRPAYFPFTEPSAELVAKHPTLGWIELAGSGIFRQEVCKPLGVTVPVLAWGIGIDRIAMFSLGIKDIRKLFSHNLNFLRNTKVI